MLQRADGVPSGHIRIGQFGKHNNREGQNAAAALQMPAHRLFRVGEGDMGMDTATENRAAQRKNVERAFTFKKHVPGGKFVVLTTWTW